MSDRVWVRNPKYKKDPVVLCSKCRTPVDLNFYCSKCQRTQEKK